VQAGSKDQAEVSNMKKRIIIPLLIALLAMAATATEAGGRGERYYGQSSGYVKYGRQYPQPRFYGHRGPNRGGYPRGVHGHRHHLQALELAAGAIVLGAVITTLDQPRPAGIVISSPRYIVRKPYAVKRDRWYQRDAYGDCFEVRLQGDGQQVWTQAPRSRCR
jgi:hypothetical protein